MSFSENCIFVFTSEALRFCVQDIILVIPYKYVKNPKVWVDINGSMNGTPYCSTCSPLLAFMNVLRLVRVEILLILFTNCSLLWSNYVTLFQS
jgi:hypothetical protein